jgi:hypothetical protein
MRYDMAPKWPRLKRLNLQSRRLVTPETQNDATEWPTFASLLELIKHCPDLAECDGFTFHLDDIFTTPTRGLVNRKIKQLNMLFPDSEASTNLLRDIAAIISTVFPNLQQETVSPPVH